MHNGRLTVLAEVLRARDLVTAASSSSDYAREQLEHAAERLATAAAVLAGGARRWHVLAAQWVVAAGVAAALASLLGFVVPTPVSVAVGIAAGAVAGPITSRSWIRWRARRGRTALAPSMRSGPVSMMSAGYRDVLLAVSRARTVAESYRFGAAPFPSSQWWGIGRVAHETRAAWRATARAAPAELGADLPAQMLQFDADDEATARAIDGEATRLGALSTELDRRASDEDLAAAAATIDAAHSILWNTATQLGLSRKYPPLPRARLLAIVVLPAIAGTAWTWTALASWPAAAIASMSLAAAVIVADTLDGIITARLAAQEPLTRAVDAVRPKPIGLPEAIATVGVWRQEVANRIKALDTLAQQIADGHDGWRPYAAKNIATAQSWLTVADDLLTSWRV